MIRIIIINFLMLLRKEKKKNQTWNSKDEILEIRNNNNVWINN